MLNLDEFIDAVTIGSRAHICVHDVSGLTTREPFFVSAARRIHSSRFCEAAKSLRGGLRLCMKCRYAANKKAETGEPFCGKCPFGVTEIAYPVISEGRVILVVYVGLLAEDLDAVREKIIKAAALLKAPARPILRAVRYLEPCADISRYYMLAAAVGEHIQMLYTLYADNEPDSGLHTAVTAAMDFVKGNYYKDITVNDAARLIDMNPKYIGRLFKEQTGETFSEYLNLIRISRAKQLLADTHAQIIEIALECGYNNVTYFNRVFKKITGLSPGDYRKKKHRNIDTYR